jgi:hypothetical protein
MAIAVSNKEPNPFLGTRKVYAPYLLKKENEVL